jgi:protein-tyrosine phosphatase
MIRAGPVQVTGGMYLGDIDDVREGDTSQFDRVITVCQDSCADNVACEYEQHSLEDGENKYQSVADAIDAVVAARIRRETVLVHCHAGVSRSPSVCIGALAVLNGLSFEEARSIVADAKYIQPSRELLDDVQQYIGEH